MQQIIIRKITANCENHPVYFNRTLKIYGKLFLNTRKSIVTRDIQMSASVNLHDFLFNQLSDPSAQIISSRRNILFTQ